MKVIIKTIYVQAKKPMNKRPVYHDEKSGVAWTHDYHGRVIMVSIEDIDLIQEYTISTTNIKRRLPGQKPSYRAFLKYLGKNQQLSKVIQKRIGFIGLCDHIDRNPLNNMRSNLRAATHESNSQNTSLYTTNTSGYRGVVFDENNGNWRASITYKEKGKSKAKHLGSFTDKTEAAKAYDRAALKYHGPHSTTNASLGLL